MLAVRTVGCSACSAVGLLYLFHVSLTCDAGRNVTNAEATAGRRLKWLRSLATDGQKLLLDAAAPAGDNPASLVNLSPGGAGVPVAVAVLGAAFLVMALLATVSLSGKGVAVARTSALLAMLVSPEAVTFMIYVGLWTCLKFSLGAGKYLNYSAMFLLAIVAAGKFVLSVALYVYQDGTMREFGKLLVDKRKDVALYCVPAAMYSLSDTLMILCLSRIDPLTYTLLINVRDVVITGLWGRMFGKKLSWMRYAAIVITSAGMVAKEFQFRHELVVPRHAEGPASARFETYMMVLLGAVAGAIGSLWNEKMLRESSVTMNAQNAVMYSFSLVISLVVHTIYSYLGHDAPMLPSSRRGKDWCLYCAIVLIFIFFGIAAAHFLKRLGNGARVGVNATMVIITAPLQMIILGYTFGSFEWLGIAIILAGMAVYARDLTQQ